ncbi:manganese-transporting P-type ATPase [Nematocida sp. LUAm3]|nr:manganese-transporting P-type ATPase [Nematocida sp. LUAm3]KAI5174872.1 manganese-transporting P-type ATPase [Nematocida sp. LUAm2]KAI5177530.1 manganese-transporting P-type ATPase [Nematocida sp. LUAm1]
MNFELFKRRPFWSHSYVVPTYFYPLVYWITSKYTFGDENTTASAISMFFLALIQGFLFLSSFWGSTIFHFSKLQRVPIVDLADMVRVEKKQGIGRETKRGYSSISTKTVLFGGKKETIKWFEFDNDLFIWENNQFKVIAVDLAHNMDIYHKDSVTERIYRTAMQKSIFPKNEFKIEPPTFLRMFAQHAVSPFFVFQIFCALLWMLDEYWKYSLFTFFSIILFEGGMVFQRLTNIRQLRSLNLSPQKIVRITKEGREEVLSTELRPGDKLLITQKIQLPADAVILKGSAILNESMLSGEAVPVAKEALPQVNEPFSTQKHKKHIVYGGTKILKIDERGIECRIIRTGFMTEQGELIKSMISSEDTVSENNYEAYLFILAMLLFAICSCVYVVKESISLGKTPYKIILECIMILTNVVPPELPMELTIAVNSSLQELVSLGVYCLEPFRIPYAGKISVCCFDKTGTLTELNFQLERVEHEETSSKLVLGLCHSAILLDGKIEGDPLDLCGIEHVKADLLSDTKIVVDHVEYQIEKRLSFDSDLRRMTVVAQDSSSRYILMKGAPEVLKEYLKEIPSSYGAYEKYASEGYRILTLAIKKEELSKNCSGKREDLEKDMKFMGFALYNSKLKEKAKETIEHLVSSDHQIVMITGDNEKTAISVAKQLGFYRGTCYSGDKEIEEFLNERISSHRASPRKTFKWPSVFARANPEIKEKIIATINLTGEHTLMCGDGTNDVGALKSAHVGLALLEGTKKKAKSVTLPGNIGQTMFILDEEIKVKLGDASVAAPFTSRTGSLQSVIDVISRGRSALVSTIQMYKVLALNSLLSAYTLSVFDTMGIRYGDFQMTAAGILSALAFTFFGKSRPLPRISRERPVARIFTKYIVTSVIVQTLIHIASFYVIYLGIVGYGPIVLQEKFSPSLANSCMFLLSTALQVTTLMVNYVGRPFRESLMENKKLFNSLVLLVVMVVACTLEMSPDINAQMELVPLPRNMKIRLLSVIGTDFLLCQLVEKASFAFFMTNAQKQVSHKKKQ